MMETIIATSGVHDSTDSISKDPLKNLRVRRVAVRIVEAGQNLCAKKVEDVTNEVARNKALISEYQHRILLLKKKYVPRLRNNLIQSGNHKSVAPTTPVEKAAGDDGDSVESLRRKVSDLHSKQADLERTITRWETAAKKLRGTWSFIVLKNSTPNAFVTDLAPRRVFVNEGLLDVIQPTDDELGLILGHELSHLILKHSSEHNKLQAFLASFQLILLIFVDPTGFSSVVIDPLNSSIMKYIENAHGRHEEEEADDLGIQITAMSCMDTKRAANVFAKFADLEEKGGGGASRWQAAWNHTHPASKDRYLKMLQESEIYNPRSHGCGWWYLTAWKKAKSQQPTVRS